MLKPHNSLTHRQTQKKTTELLCYASDLMESMAITSKEEFESCILRTLRVCSSLNISIDENFKQVYVSDKDELYIDLKLSALACYLLTVNGDPTNPHVAKAQMYYATKTSTHVKI